MGKYEQDARLLLEYVGGKENIAAVSHCVSRMRFVLNDPAKADVAKIEALKSAKGTFTQAGQFQVIIGNTVSDFYNDFITTSLRTEPRTICPQTGCPSSVARHGSMCRSWASGICTCSM